MLIYLLSVDLWNLFEMYVRTDFHYKRQDNVAMMMIAQDFRSFFFFYE